MVTNTLLQSGGAGIIVLFGIVALIVSIALIVWTYSDAEKNSSHPAFLWALVVFFAPFIGLILYLILGRDQTGGY